MRERGSVGRACGSGDEKRAGQGRGAASRDWSSTSVSVLSESGRRIVSSSALSAAAPPPAPPPPLVSSSVDASMMRDQVRSAWVGEAVAACRSPLSGGALAAQGPFKGTLSGTAALAPQCRLLGRAAFRAQAAQASHVGLRPAWAGTARTAGAAPRARAASWPSSRSARRRAWRAWKRVGSGACVGMSVGVGLRLGLGVRVGVRGS